MTVRAVFGVPQTGEPAPGPGVFVVVGNFDGVHLGHRRLLEVARTLVGSGGRVVALTFEPHPAQLLRPETMPGLLTPLGMRRRLLAGAGADEVLVLPFGEHLRSLEPDQFLDRIRHLYAVRGLVGGPRLSLGRGDSGGVDFARAYCEERGLQMEVVPEVKIDGAEVSSTGLRRLLGEGHLESYARAAGGPFGVLGEVVRGDGLGRRLGFPTANLRLPPGQLLPPDGVYVMSLSWPGRECRPALGSIGTRPHFGGADLRFEVHCLEPTPELYGVQVHTEVLSYLRPQLAFSSESELVAEMRRDRERARARLRLA